MVCGVRNFFETGEAFLLLFRSCLSMEKIIFTTWQQQKQRQTKIANFYKNHVSTNLSIVWDFADSCKHTKNRREAMLSFER